MRGNEARSAITSLDVARRVGVSQSAVSLVLGGKGTGRVGTAAQAAILRAARELGYSPNGAARTLRSGRSRMVALAVPDASNPYFAAVLHGAAQVARQRGYAALLASFQEEHDWQQMLLDALSSRSVDGVLVFAPPRDDVHPAFQGRAVLVDATSDVLPCLLLEIEAGMRAAVEHLLRLGHTKIAHLAAAVDAQTFDLRRTAYEATLRVAGLPIVAAYQRRAAFTIADARQAARRILESPESPSAIVCDSDVLAAGVYKAAKDLHRAIPEDLSVVGFDDSLVARLLDPELTTVAIPTTTIGEQALLLLHAVLEQEYVPARTGIPLELVIRASTTGA
jgi:DNA-binding LacI/PurR family transcriptional regulator